MKLIINEKAKEKPRPFSRLPIYRFVRSKITDDARRSVLLGKFYREYHAATNQKMWNKTHDFSYLFNWTHSPEGEPYWFGLHKELFGVR